MSLDLTEGGCDVPQAERRRHQIDSTRQQISENRAHGENKRLGVGGRRYNPLMVKKTIKHPHRAQADGAPRIAAPIPQVSLGSPRLLHAVNHQPLAHDTEASLDRWAESFLNRVFRPEVIA